jgi:hypothetical protein
MMMIIGWLIRVETGIGSVFVFCSALLYGIFRLYSHRFD